MGARGCTVIGDVYFLRRIRTYIGSEGNRTWENRRASRQSSTQVLVVNGLSCHTFQIKEKVRTNPWLSNGITWRKTPPTLTSAGWSPQTECHTNTPIGLSPPTVSNSLKGEKFHGPKKKRTLGDTSRQQGSKSKFTVGMHDYH